MTNAAMRQRLTKRASHRNVVDDMSPLTDATKYVARVMPRQSWRSWRLSNNRLVTIFDRWSAAMLSPHNPRRRFSGVGTGGAMLKRLRLRRTNGRRKRRGASLRRSFSAYRCRAWRACSVNRIVGSRSMRRGMTSPRRARRFAATPRDARMSGGSPLPGACRRRPMARRRADIHRR